MESNTIVSKIKNHALRRVENYLSKLSIREQQVFINHVVRYYDYLYNISLQENKNSDEIHDFINFSFPVVMRYIYKNYESIEGNPLVPSSREIMQDIESILNVCFKAGLMENYEELLRYQILKYNVTAEKSATLSYTNEYYSIERFEKTQNVKYSHAMMRALQGEYMKDIRRLSTIIKKMEKLVFTWNHNFIGYDADPEVDLFFIRNAQLDFAQATEWRGFPPTSKFGDIEYHLYLSVLIAIESVCLKHLQFTEIAIKKDSNLESLNILPCIVDYDELVSSLSSFLGTTEATIQKIIQTLIFDEENKLYFKQINSPNPPFIRLSSTQLLRSFCGCIYRPIDFMLAEIKRLFPKDWDRNTKEREQIFREELYKYFSNERYTTINRSIDIIENGSVITDIDACIVDKETLDIALIQLKWQDSIYDSTRSLVSKRKNYIDKSTKWAADIKKWIQETPEKRIADFLQLSPKNIIKDKIKIFVIGRNNGNYSGDSKPCDNVAWSQWYSLIEIIETCLQEEGLTIPRLYDSIQKKSPYSQDKQVRPFEVNYGNYSVKIDAPPYNQA